MVIAGEGISKSFFRMEPFGKRHAKHYHPIEYAGDPSFQTSHPFGFIDKRHARPFHPIGNAGNPYFQIFHPIGYIGKRRVQIFHLFECANNPSFQTFHPIEYIDKRRAQTFPPIKCAGTPRPTIPFVSVCRQWMKNYRNAVLLSIAQGCRR